MLCSRRPQGPYQKQTNVSAALGMCLSNPLCFSVSISDKGRQIHYARRVDSQTDWSESNEVVYFFRVKVHGLSLFVDCGTRQSVIHTLLLIFGRITLSLRCSACPWDAASISQKIFFRESTTFSFSWKNKEKCPGENNTDIQCRYWYNLPVVLGFMEED